MRGLGGIALCLVLLSMSIADRRAHAKPVAGRRFGVGLVVGEPTGVTGYVSLGQRFAVDAALGVVSPGERDLAGHADGLIILGGDARSSFTGAFTFGVGAFFIRYFGNLFAGARFPLGLAAYAPRARLSVYGEVSVEILLARPYDTARDTNFQTALGIRFFF